MEMFHYGQIGLRVNVDFTRYFVYSIEAIYSNENENVLCKDTRLSWFLIWVSDWCRRAALASTAALRSLSRRSASS